MIRPAAGGQDDAAPAVQRAQHGVQRWLLVGALVRAGRDLGVVAGDDRRRCGAGEQRRGDARGTRREDVDEVVAALNERLGAGEDVELVAREAAGPELGEEAREVVVAVVVIGMAVVIGDQRDSAGTTAGRCERRAGLGGSDARELWRDPAIGGPVVHDDTDSPAKRPNS